MRAGSRSDQLGHVWDSNVRLTKYTLLTSANFHCRADSWRARVSHICELQVNMSSGAMKIDFGGLDRWDYAERQRNTQEAETPGDL
jgi:hypothetical protein